VSKSSFNGVEINVNETLLRNFPGSKNIIVIQPSDSKTKQYYLPRVLHENDPSNTWTWWKERKNSEKTLNQAIMSKKVYKKYLFECY
jgi:hypothetical protein